MIPNQGPWADVADTPCRQIESYSLYSTAYKFAVDTNVAQRKMHNILDDVRPCHTLKVTVGQPDAFDRRVVEPPKIEGILSFLGGKIADLYITYNWNKLSSRSFFIEEIDGKSGRGNLSYVNVPDINVLQQPAAHGVVLDAYRAVEMRAIHNAVLGENIAHTAGDFAADRH